MVGKRGIDRVKEIYDREYAPVQIAALRDARARFEAVADSLDAFRVVSARLTQQDGFMGREAIIQLTVKNGTLYPISKAYFRGRAITEGRSVLWIEENFNYQIPGGLEAGERASWRLEPGLFASEWTSVEVPSAAEFHVQVRRLDDASGEPLWGCASFTVGDQQLLDSLVGRFGG
jgi:hypothetical protein